MPAFPLRHLPGIRAMRQLTLALTAGLALSACSPADSADTPAAPAPAAPAPAPAPAPTPTPAAPTTQGGDGSQIQLDALSEADLREAKLAGELACSFATGNAQPLLLAKGNVASQDAAQGIVKVAGYVERISAPGGYDGMTQGASFSGKGKTIEIALTGAATEGGESPPRPATLTYQRADGASQVLEGRWQCGP